MRITLRQRILWQWWLLLSLASITTAQNPYILPRLPGPITLDGKSDEAAWQYIQPLPLRMSYPTYNGEPTEKTEIRIAYDDYYLYASARLYDSNPAGVQATSLKRDGSGGSSDSFSLLLDTYNDNENAVSFMTTPTGNRIDRAIYNDGESFGPPPIDDTWNTFWDVAVVQTNEGWFVEMRIPFSSLRFQERNGSVIFGLIARRRIARKNEEITFPVISQNYNYGLFKPSLAQDVVLQGIQSHNPVYVTPYALAGVDEIVELNESKTAYNRLNNGPKELGFDIKYGLTSNLTMDLTANTDFAQVESDEQQVNLTRFSLFFPERRQFFLERSSIFDFNAGNQTRLFYSRRIGLDEDDKPVRILGGARLIGRIGDWDLGFLDMQTDRSAALPSENFGVLRFRRRVINENSYAGGMVTSRLGANGRYNAAYGADGVFKLQDDDFLSVNLSQTFEGSPGKSGRVSFGDASRILARIERRTTVGLGYSVDVAHSGPQYNPGAGFVDRTDFTRYEGYVFYGIHQPENSPLQLYQPGTFTSFYWRNGDGTLESGRFDGGLGMQYRSGAWLWFGGRYQYEDVRESFKLSDDDSTRVLVGTYKFYGANLYFFSPQGNLFQINGNAALGTFYDGTQYSLTVNPTWSISRNLELSGSYQYNRIRFHERGEKFDSHIIRLRLDAAMNTMLSASILSQYNSLSEAVVINFRIRYCMNEGNDLYLVYNEGLNTNPMRSLPERPFSNSRTILAKYTYTFAL
ncbi:MAG: carbohydrate binding family 9 domain-containing protein [Ignavibacteriales bacterium]|nr:carbohydrate binding family 9 domain-containing protein [Ignavibacteriales bacterium]